MICIIKLVNSIVRSLSNRSIQLSDHCQINLILFSLFEINDFGIDTSTDVEHSWITSNVAFSRINCTDMRTDVELTLELTDLTLIWHRTLDLIVRSKCQIKYQFNFKNNYFILQKIFWLNWYSNWPIWPKQIDRL